jgi:hypothetical protein
MRRALLLVASLALLVIVDTAWARDGAPIVLTGEGSPELSRRLRAEAEHIGFTIAERDGGDALAVVRVVSADRVELEIAGAVPELRAVERRAGEGDSFALRAAEELRGRLTELNLLPAPAPSAAVPDPPPPAPAPIAASPSPPPSPAPPPADRGPSRAPTGAEARLWARGGAGVLAPFGGVGPTGLAVLGLGVEPFHPSWELSAVAMLPLTENEVTEAEGEAEVGVHAFLGELEHHAAFSAKWFLSAAVGGGALVLETRAETVSPFVAHDETLVAGIYFVRVGLVRRVAPWLRLRASALGGVSAPRPLIRFDDRDVAAWGRTFGGVTLDAELGMPLGGRASP